MPMLTTVELAKLLSLEVDALSMKAFADTETPTKGKEILFTGYDIYTHSELLAMHTANMETLEMAYRAESSQV